MCTIDYDVSKRCCCRRWVGDTTAVGLYDKVRGKLLTARAQSDTINERDARGFKAGP
jgi:hypothetical protein